MLQVLKQCNGDFSRENIMKQVTNLHDVSNPVLLPGIKINTSPTNYPSDQGDAVGEVGRQDLGAFRRRDPGRGVLTFEAWR